MVIFYRPGFPGLVAPSAFHASAHGVQPRASASVSIVFLNVRIGVELTEACFDAFDSALSSPARGFRGPDRSIGFFTGEPSGRLNQGLQLREPDPMRGDDVSERRLDGDGGRGLGGSRGSGTCPATVQGF